MPYNPLIILLFLGLCAGVLALPGVGGAFGVAHDATLPVALVYAEMSAAALLLLPVIGAGRAVVLRNLLAVFACVAVASACVALLGFTTRESVAWDTRSVAIPAWLFAGGMLSLGARLGGPWRGRMRVVTLCVFALPPLWHYLALEYSGASLLYLRGLSPHWALAAGADSWLPLLPVAAILWGVAFALPNARDERAEPESPADGDSQGAAESRPASGGAASLTGALLLALLAPALAAQGVDHGASGFLTGPHARTGSCAPYRVVFHAEHEIEIVEARHGRVVLRRRVAATPGETVEALLPAPVADGVTIHAGGESFAPRLPALRVGFDYRQPYIGVFSVDPVYTRPLLPSAPGRIICDYHEIHRFFTDWRMLDGYDAIVLFQPEAGRLPAGAQRAIAEFCSLGGAAVVIGSFHMGEAAEDLPAPGEPTVVNLDGVRALRFPYGPGAVYRIGFEELRASPAPNEVVRRAVVDHLWFGLADPPGGAPDWRGPSPTAPMLQAAPPEPARITALFFLLAGALLITCLMAPAIAGRARLKMWTATPAIMAISVILTGLAALQPRPLPAIDIWAIAHTDEAGLGWTRTFVLAERDWMDSLVIDLDEDRGLPRPWRSADGRHGWQIDMPLQHAASEHADAALLEYGLVNGRRFRDFAARAQRGETPFTSQQARLLDWWLEANAYRGRTAALAPGEWSPETDWGGVVRARGTLRVVNERPPDR